MNIWRDKKWGPMLLKEIFRPFDSKDYIFELKFDGHRAIVFASPKKVIICNRHQQDISFLYPELQGIKNIVKENTIFDGEIVMFANGNPSFSRLQKRAHLKTKNKIQLQSEENPVVFICFDILFKKKDITSLPLLERKKILENFNENDVFVKNKFIDTDGKKLFSYVKKKGLEGIVAKRKDSTYLVNSRTENWIKIKNLKREAFYIGGYIERENSFVISLLLGEYKKEKLYFVGKVTLAKKQPLYKKILASKKQKTSSFTNYHEEGIFIAPTFKCQIIYLERTENNHLRQPVYQNEDV